jgi:phage shock protein A
MAHQTTGSNRELETRLASAEAEVAGLKALLEEVKASRDQLRRDHDDMRQDRDSWRERAALALPGPDAPRGHAEEPKQRPSIWRRMFGRAA